MKTLEEIRSELRKQCSITAGVDGEKYAREWLQKAEWNYECVEQGISTLSKKLKEYGGKRPDFIADANNDTFILLDAKYHSTENCISFILTDIEIGKYHALQKFLREIFSDLTFEVIFMVFPKEKNGKRLTFVSLDEFKNGEHTILASEHATKISLLDRDDLWFDT